MDAMLGEDNNCDIDGAVDECEEDAVPPTIDATATYAACASTNKVFSSVSEALTCVEENTLATDDCLPTMLSFTHVGSTDDTCSDTIIAMAVAQGCENRIDEDTSVLDIPVEVDSVAPIAGCSFGSDVIYATKDGAIVDAEFSFSATDNCDDSLHVTIEVLSSEVVLTGEEMVAFSSLAAGLEEDDFKLFVEADICYDRESGSSDDQTRGRCKIDSHRNARTYAVRIVAEDAAGNVGTDECAMVVFDPPSGKGKGGKKDPPRVATPPDPDLDVLFSLAKFEFTQTTPTLR